MLEKLYFRRRYYKKIALSFLKKSWKKILEAMSNRYIAFTTMAIILIGISFIRPDLWKYIVSALITYFVATIFMRYSLSRGLFKVKKFGKSTVAEGHAFVALIVIIIIATFFSNWLPVFIDSIFLSNPHSKIIIATIQTLTILALLLLDLRSEF